MTFLGASIPLLTIQVDYVIQYTKPTVPREPANAYAAGYIVLIVVQVSLYKTRNAYHLWLTYHVVHVDSRFR